MTIAAILFALIKKELAAAAGIYGCDVIEAASVISYWSAMQINQNSKIRNQIASITVCTCLVDRLTASVAICAFLIKSVHYIHSE